MICSTLNAISVLTAFALLVGCFPSSDSGQELKNDLSTESSVSSGLRTTPIDGLYDVSIDQGDVSKWLLFDGELYGYDSSFGYIGTASFEAETGSTLFNVMRYPLTLNDQSSQLKVASGSPVALEFSGLQFTQSISDDSIVGDYSGVGVIGSFLMADDTSWSLNTTLNQLVGEWSAGQHRLFITDINGHLRFKGINPALAGCHYEGSISYADSLGPLFSLLIEEKSNCEGFNHSNAEGYALVSVNNQLLWFSQMANELMIASFERSQATSVSDDGVSTDVEDVTEQTEDVTDETTNIDDTAQDGGV